MNTRAGFEKELIDTCDIYRPTTSTNTSYEVVSSLSLFAEDVPCMMAMPTGRKVLTPAGIDPSKFRIVYFKYNQDIQERDQVDFNGRRYVVNAVDITHRAHHKEAMCETVIGG